MQTPSANTPGGSDGRRWEAPEMRQVRGGVSARGRPPAARPGLRRGRHPASERTRAFSV